MSYLTTILMSILFIVAWVITFILLIILIIGFDRRNYVKKGKKGKKVQ
jgi:predicted secreted protein